MHQEPITVIIQRYPDALPGDTTSEPVVGELLELLGRGLENGLGTVDIQVHRIR